MILLNYKLFSRIIYSIILIVTCILTGTVGYILIEGYSTIDAFYMTIITVSTVGFSEVQALSDQGKLFTTALIFLSFGTFAYAITSISAYLLGGEYRLVKNRLKEQRKIKSMKNHVIICGFGRVGRQVALDFIAKNQPFVVLELDKNRVDPFKEDDNYNFVVGDATADANLEKANIREAKAVITCMPVDANNLYVVLAAKELNSSVQIIARASKIDTLNKLKFAGANNVIMPDSVGGSHMASLVVRPDIMEFMDEIRLSDESTPNIVGIPYEKLPVELQNKTLGQFKVISKAGCNIVGLKYSNGKYIINPTAEEIIGEGSKLFILGDTIQIKALKKQFDFL
ncbi:MAG: potassium channel family protein [Lishizhenia sp.]